MCNSMPLKENVAVDVGTVPLGFLNYFSPRQFLLCSYSIKLGRNVYVASLLAICQILNMHMLSPACLG